MKRWFWRAKPIRMGLAAACISGTFLIGAVVKAVRVDYMRGGAESNSLLAMPGSPTPAPGYDLDRVLAAVAQDPFNPERRRPGVRFRLPAQRAAASARREATQAIDTSLRLVGTAVASNGGGFAMCAWQGGNPRIVKVGEKVGDWTLRRVLPGAAEFVTSAGTTITVRVPKLGA